MGVYRNKAGYPDPSAGEALANIERTRKRRLKRLDTIEAYEHLCCKFREMADAQGFSFPSQIWLRHKKSGAIFKKG